MTFEKKFEQLKSGLTKGDLKKLKGSFAIQVNMTDEDCGGAFYMARFNDTLAIEPYDYNDRTAEIIADSDTVTRFFDGRVSYSDAINSGRLTVYGNEADVQQFEGIASKPKRAAKKAKAAAKSAKKAVDAAVEKAKPVVKQAEKVAKDAVEKAKPVVKQAEKAAKDAAEKAKPIIKQAAATAVEKAKPVVKQAETVVENVIEKASATAKQKGAKK